MKLSSTVAALAAAAAFLITPLGAAAQQSDNLPARVIDFAMTTAPDDHIMGSEDAVQTMIIWASVTCGHCANWFSDEWPIVKSELIETGKLRVVFREFPTQPGNLSMAGFRLAGCAPTEDYMSIIEYQMENQDAILKAAQEGRGEDAYREIARLAGMETNAAMSSCLRNPDITAHIVDNLNRATLAEVVGVPAFLINGQKYKGKSDAKTLVKLITEMEEKGVSALPDNIEPTNAHDGHDHK